MFFVFFVLKGAFAQTPEPNFLFEFSGDKEIHDSIVALSILEVSQKGAVKLTLGDEIRRAIDFGFHSSLSNNCKVSFEREPIQAFISYLSAKKKDKFSEGQETFLRALHNNASKIMHTRLNDMTDEQRTCSAKTREEQDKIKEMLWNTYTKKALGHSAGLKHLQ